MNGIRKLAFLIAAFALAAFALPASADNKIYNLTISGSPVAAGTLGAPMTATFANITPDGNSTFKSLKLFTPPGGGLTIKTVTVGPGYSANITYNGTSVYADSINPPVKPFSSKPFTLVMTVDVACSATGGSWTTIQNSLQQVWTGSGWTGSNFALNNPPFPVTTVNGTGGCTYTLSGIPATVAAGSTNSLTIGLANNAATGGPSITKLVLTLPAGLSVPGTYVPPAGVAVSGNQVTVTRTVAAAGSTSFALTVNAAASCTATAAASWSPTVTPASFSGNDPTTAITAQACSVSINAPTSAAVNVEFAVTVNLTGGPGGANVTVTSSDCTLTGGGPTAATGYSASFPTVKITNVGVCTLNVSADQGYGSTSITSFKVYAGVLDCNVSATPTFPPVPGPGYFTSSPSGVTLVTQPGFAAGYRVNGDKSESCDLVDYTFTNNIKGSSSVIDAFGVTLPPNAVSFVWDQTFKPNAVFVYELTFQPEYVDAITGLPKRHTKFCILGATDCTLTANQVNLQACIGTALSSSSIPGSDPACIRLESWVGVPDADCVAAGQTNPNAPGLPPACVRNTNIILDGRDPPINRG